MDCMLGSWISPGLADIVFRSSKIPPFVTKESITASPDRKLSVVCDVSADSTNPFSPGSYPQTPAMSFTNNSPCRSPHLYKNHDLR